MYIMKTLLVINTVISLVCAYSFQGPDLACLMTCFIILSVTIGWSVCLASAAESSSNSLC